MDTNDTDTAYLDVAMAVAETTEAAGSLLMVVGGNQGNNFVVLGDPQFRAMLPSILEKMAKQMRDEMGELVLLPTNSFLLSAPATVQ
jgi:ectoine hydroxylase-related dioxygenase (phytanoyl-CoA dioxygenase family)